jgi:hypothetical protein
MALQPPTTQHLQRLGEAHHFELNEDELAAFQSRLPGTFAALDTLDQAPSNLPPLVITSAIRVGGRTAKAIRSMPLFDDAR